MEGAQDNLQSIQQQLAEVERKWAALLQSFSEAAPALNAGTSLPSQDLLEQIKDLRWQCTSLRKTLLTSLSHETASHTGDDEPANLEELRTLSKALNEMHVKCAIEGEARSRALLLLGKVQEILHRDGIEFGPLSECQAQARDLQLNISRAQGVDPDPETQALAAGTHPFARLVSSVEGREESTDEQWEQIFDLIAKTWGRPLAVAVARNRLGFEETPADEVTEVATAHPPEPASDETAQLATSVESKETTPLEGSPAAETVHQGGLATDLGRSSILEVGTRALRGGEKTSADFPPELVPTIPKSPSVDKVTTHPSGTLVRREEAPPSTKARPDVRLMSRTSLRELAIAIRDEPIDSRQTFLTLLQWRLLEEQRFGLAFHLARCLEDMGVESFSFLPSWLMRATALAPVLRHGQGDIAGGLKRDFDYFAEDIFAHAEEEPWNHAVRLILAGAALRPALLAPETGASAILHSLRMKDGLQAVYAYCQAIARCGDGHQPLDPAALRTIKTQDVWEGELRGLHQAVEAWCAQAPRMTIIFAPATNVWRKWQEPGGLIHSLLDPVRRNETNRLDLVRELVNRLEVEARIKREVDHTDRQVLKRRLGEDISAKAIGQILARVREAVSYARHWLDLQNSRPDQVRGYLHKLAEQLREELRSLHGPVVEELAAFGSRHDSPPVRAGVICCRRAVQSVQALFDSEGTLSSTEPDPRMILHAELLKTLLPLNEAWDPETAAGQTLEGLLSLLAHDPVDWGYGFTERCRHGDLEGAERIVEFLKATGAEAQILGGLEETLKESLRESHEALKNGVDQTRKEIEKAVAFGLLREAERAELVAKTDAVLLALPRVRRFKEKHDQLREVSEFIEGKHTAEVCAARARLESVATRLDQSAFQQIDRVLTNGDVLTANEYMDMALEGKSLPPETSASDIFVNFFPKTFQDITDFLEKEHPDLGRIAAGIRAYSKGQVRTYQIGPVDLFDVPGPQAGQAADLLERWHEAKRAGRVEKETLKLLLAPMGFAPKDITVETPPRHVRRCWANFVQDPIQDRERCPVPYYGSNAHGRYRVFCVWDRPTEEELLTDVGETAQKAPTIVLFFGRMSERVRRYLAQASRQKFRTFIVVDEVLVVFLCGVRGLRLPVLFQCTLPFTHLEPYTVTAGLVPPEVFYGRRREREQIIDAMKSCFIYGGRQLGKTALLRDVERTFHAPQEGRIALWLDLKTHGIGYDRSIDEIWNLLAQVFKRVGVVPTTMPAHAGVETLFAHIQTWLDQDRGRRILLLLDEADRFLDHDGRHTTKDQPEQGDFIRATRLKGLMDRTERRFKVVFAGLHNVQRTTRLENHPLAHYGDPICIGPLLDGGEWREAQALVERPLASIGHHFDTVDLVTRILSQTNYYPSLIQLYCSQLHRHLHTRHFDPRTSPPYLITSAHVEDAYQSQELRKAIRDRFLLTLNLDQRYRIIAYCLALYSLDEIDIGKQGFPVAWIRDQAQTFWSQGFKDIGSEDTFKVLLDEMVGLGVLRVVSLGRYSLRSLNVINLLGTREEIEAELLSSQALEPPPEYEAASFRTALRKADGMVDHSRRNPLTAQQESELLRRQNGVTVLLGCQAAGLEDLPVFFQMTFGGEFLVILDDVFDLNSLVQQLDNLADREREGITLVLLPATCPWSEVWIERALGRINRLKSKRSFVRIVFVADPASARGLLRADRSLLDRLVEKGASTLSLTPWKDSAVRHWLDDCEFVGADRDGREKIAAVTGNWPALLYRLYQGSKTKQHHWHRALTALEQELADPQRNETFLSLFGLSDPDFRRVLKDLADLEEASEEDLVGIAETTDSELVGAALRWANSLSLVHPAGSHHYRLDPLVARLLRERTS